MKIAFFTDVLLPPSGGIEQHVLDTSRALAERGHEVRVYYPDPGSGHDNSAPQSSTLLNLAFRPVPGLPMTLIWPNFRFSFPLHLYGQVKSWQPDVIHFHTSGPMATAAIVLSKLLKVKLVGTFHSYLMEDEYLRNFQFSIFNFQIGFGRLSPLIWAYVRWVFNRCNVVVSPSQWVAADIKAHGIKKPVVVVHNGASLSEYGHRAGEKAISDFKSKYNLPDDTLLYVGRLSQEKGLDVLFRAVQMTNDQLPISKLKLLLVGDGPQEEELKKLANDLGISGQVIFVGRINHPDLPGSGVFEASKAFVTASCSENQPLTIIEALAKGLPIIGVSARGVTELVNGNGLLALPNDPHDLATKIQQLIADEEGRIKMSEVSRQMSQDYSLTKAAERLEKLYAK